MLVREEDLFRNRVPTVPGGGTVAYVSGGPSTATSTDIEQREEGGTPAIIGSIRAGLVFQLKEAVGRREHPEREHAHFIQPRHRPRGRPTRT